MLGTARLGQRQSRRVGPYTAPGGGGGVAPSVSDVTINGASAGNGVLVFTFAAAVTSLSNNNDIPGFTFQVQDPVDSAWETIADADVTGVRQGDTTKVHFTLSGVIDTFQSSQNVRWSYSQATGDLVDAATSSAELADVTNQAVDTNSSDVDLPNGLVVRWGFDRVATATIDSDYDLTEVGVTYADGLLADGADFESTESDRYRVLSLSGNLPIPSGNFTIMTWYNPESFPGSTLFVQGNASNNRISLEVDSGGIPQFTVNTGTTYSVNGGAISTATWESIGGSYDGTSQALIVGGTEVDTDLATANYLGDRIVIGADAAQSANFADGIMDEMAIWNRELSAAELTDYDNDGVGKPYPYLPGATPALQTVEVGAVDSKTVVLDLGTRIYSPGNDYTAGFTIKVNTDNTRTFTAARGTNNKTIEFTLTAGIGGDDTVTIEYASASGDIVAEVDGTLALADISSTTVTNTAWGVKDIPGLRLWLRTDGVRTGATAILWQDNVESAVADTNLDPIGRWKDESDEAHDLDQTTAGTLPTMISGGVNTDIDTVSFDGGDLLFTADAPTNWNTSIGTAFVVIGHDTNGVTDYYLASCDEASDTRFLGFSFQPDNQLATFQRDNDTQDFVTSTNTITNSAAHCIMHATVTSGTGYRIDIDGTTETLIVDSGSDNGDWLAETSARDNISVGGLQRTSAAAQLNGDIAEIIYYDTEISGANIASVEIYLANKYGITFA